MGADIGARNQAGETPLQIAVQRSNETLIGLLSEKTAERNPEDKAVGEIKPKTSDNCAGGRGGVMDSGGAATATAAEEIQAEHVMGSIVHPEDPLPAKEAS